MEENLEKVAGEHIGQETSIKRVGAASLIGSVIEWYDFYIYQIAAGLVLGSIFFPEFSVTAGALAAFATFTVGFIARPLGAVLFGHFGDRVGRKAMLVTSLLMMGFATFAIGFLPGYAAIGVAAPLLLVALRFIQGIGLGGEWGGAVLLAAEYAPRGKRGFYAGLPNLAAPIGLLIANGIFIVAGAVITEDQMSSWGWRLPFLLSILLVGVGFYIRIRIAETPAFRKAMEVRSAARIPAWEAVRAYPVKMLLGTGLVVALGAPFGVFAAFSLFYATSELGLSSTSMLYSLLIASIFWALAILVFSSLSDRVGRKNLCLLGTVAVAIWAFPGFWLINTGNLILITLAISVALVTISIIYGPQAAFLSEQFDTRVRYSATSISYALGSVLGSGLAPLISTELLASTGGSWAVSLYLIGVSAIGFVSALFLGETYRTDLTAVPDVGERMANR